MNTRARLQRKPLAASIEQLSSSAMAPSAYAPPPSSSSVSDEREEMVGSKTLTEMSQAGIGVERLVCQTSRPWRAIDVYVQTDIIAAVLGTLSVFVYANVGGLRALLSSGRMVVGGAGAGGLSVAVPRWLASARSIPVLIEVTASWDTPSTAGVQGGGATIVAVASNDAEPAPAHIGVESLTQQNQEIADATAIGFTALVSKARKSEIVAVRATNGAAAARWLQFFDLPASPANGTSPHQVWPLGAAIGDGVVDTMFRYRVINGHAFFATSSTLATLTRTADCSMFVMAR